MTKVFYTGCILVTIVVIIVTCFAGILKGLAVIPISAVIAVIGRFMERIKEGV